MLKIHNSLTGTKEDFKPLVDGKVSMYVCGMTVYDYCHLGHARVLVSFDVIVRHLRSQGYDVTYVRNITDIDDKILNRASENGEPFDDLTARMIDAMHEDEVALGNKLPDIEPRATEFMQQIIDMIQVLVDKGFAYQGETGDVYYRASKFAEYGKLNNRKLEEMLAGARIEVEASKEHPADFVLWKPAKAGEVAWESPWGKGRPGWHIECSAMSTHCLGAHFDIHGGGPDLKFPHHENEIAQSEAASGKVFSRYWMHNGLLTMKGGQKMGKSLGNVINIRDAIKEYPAEAATHHF